MLRSVAVRGLGRGVGQARHQTLAVVVAERPDHAHRLLLDLFPEPRLAGDLILGKSGAVLGAGQHAQRQVDDHRRRRVHLLGPAQHPAHRVDEVALELGAGGVGDGLRRQLHAEQRPAAGRIIGIVGLAAGGEVEHMGAVAGAEIGRAAGVGAGEAGVDRGVFAGLVEPLARQERVDVPPLEHLSEQRGARAGAGAFQRLQPDRLETGLQPRPVRAAGQPAEPGVEKADAVVDHRHDRLPGAGGLIRRRLRFEGRLEADAARVERHRRAVVELLEQGVIGIVGRAERAVDRVFVGQPGIGVGALAAPAQAAQLERLHQQR